jgi:hypothetical protein
LNAYPANRVQFFSRLVRLSGGDVIPGGQQRRSQEASQAVTPDFAQRFLKLIAVFFNDFIYIKGFVAAPAVGFDALSRRRQSHACRTAGRTDKHKLVL